MHIEKINFKANLYCPPYISQRASADELNYMQDYADKMDADIFVYSKTRELSIEDDKYYPVYKSFFIKGAELWQKTFNFAVPKKSLLKDNSGVTIHKEKDSRLNSSLDKTVRNISEVSVRDTIAVDKVSDKPFSGVLVIHPENDKTVMMEYENGLLTKSTLRDKKDNILSESFFAYDEDNKVCRYIRKNSKGDFYILKANPDNSWDCYDNNLDFPFVFKKESDF